jgi:predicted ATP-binding protein involved in virulence
MKITEMAIQGYRGFSSEKIKFGQQLTILVGANGAGKSTILDGLFLLLSFYSSRLLGSKAVSARIQETDIRIGVEQASLRLLAHDDSVGDVCWTITKQGFANGF